MEAAQEAARSEARTVAEAEVIIVCVRGAAWAEWTEWAEWSSCSKTCFS